jgi:Fe-S-cluster containining protein
MEINANEMKKTIKEIYSKLDKVSPVNFDCGKLCGEVCCVYDNENEDSEELVLYLLPGEELMYEDSDSFELYYVDYREIKYPPSWKNQAYLVRCINPPKCDRSIRPIQCRTFPLIPHLTKNGEFHLVFDEHEFPYECPIIHKNIKINDDFIKVTYDVWMRLLSNPLVYDLVDMDSRIRDNRKTDYEIII